MFSFGITAENFEVFENHIFDCKVFRGWWVRVNVILLVSSFCDVCSAVSRSISCARCLPMVKAESG